MHLTVWHTCATRMLFWAGGLHTFLLLVLPPTTLSPPSPEHPLIHLQCSRHALNIIHRRTSTRSFKHIVCRHKVAWFHVQTLSHHEGMFLNVPPKGVLPLRVAMPVQHARVSEQPQESTFPLHKKCSKQVSSWRHTSCHADKNRYYTCS